MIEQGIYFALGCMITALLALLFAPVFWRRALRLTRQRLQLQVPLSMQEILAERDQLRAGFAVERLRLEQRMERIQGSKTKDLIEIGRRTMEAGALADEVAALRRLEQAQQKEVDLLMREAVENGAEKSALSVALHETEMKVEALRGEAKAAHESQTSRRVEAEGNLVESLRNRLEAAMGQATRHETASLSVRRELDDAKTHIRELERELDQLRRSGPDARRSVVQDAGVAAQANGDLELRESIHALGVAVAKLTREPHEDDGVRKRTETKEKRSRSVGVA